MLLLDKTGLHAAWLDLSTGEFKVATDARAEKKNLVGPLNGGWAIGKRLLQHERSGIAGLVNAVLRNLSRQRDEFLALAESGEFDAPPWLAQALDAVATTIAGTMNVMGLRRVVITGSLTELPPAVVEYLSQAIRNGALWARFGKIECESAPRRRMTGLVAVGIDRLVIPICEPDEKIQPGRLP